MYQISELVTVGGTCLPCRCDVLLGRPRFSTKRFAWACAVLGIIPLPCASGLMVFMCPVAALTAPPVTQWVAAAGASAASISL
jgi:hypothetical protein